MRTSRNSAATTPAYTAAVAASAAERALAVKYFVQVGAALLALVMLSQASFRAFVASLALAVWEAGCTGYAGLDGIFGSTVRVIFRVVSETPVALSSFTILVVVLAASYMQSKRALIERLSIHFTGSATLDVAAVRAEQGWIRRYSRGVVATSVGVVVLTLLNSAVIWPIDLSPQNFFFEEAYLFSYLAVFLSVCFIGYAFAHLRGEVSLPHQIFRARLTVQAKPSGKFQNRIAPIQLWRTSDEGVAFISALVSTGFPLGNKGLISHAIGEAAGYYAAPGSEDYHALFLATAEMQQFGLDKTGAGVKL